MKISRKRITMRVGCNLVLSLFTSLPLKKARNSIGAPMVSGLTRPLVNPPPHTHTCANPPGQAIGYKEIGGTPSPTDMSPPHTHTLTCHPPLTPPPPAVHDGGSELLGLCEQISRGISSFQFMLSPEIPLCWSCSYKGENTSC